MKKRVFDNVNYGGLDLRNRTIRSATADLVDNMDGIVSDSLIESYNDLSSGKVGLIISGLAEVVEGTLTHNFLSVSNDSHIEGLTKLAEAVHNNDGKVLLQIVHHGAQVVGTPDYKPFVPSENTEELPFEVKEVTIDEINNIVAKFGDAALRAKTAGFDGVQVHGAHGYFLSRFLTPFYNRRKDQYGGSLENRARIILEVFRDIKSKCGDDFPIFIKINSSDFLDDGGFTFEECREVVKMLDKEGFNGVEISGGINIGKHFSARPFIRTVEEEGYHVEYAKTIADEVNLSVAVVGGFKTFEKVEESIQDNNIVAVSFSRPLIKEPQLIKRWEDGDTTKSGCISCNKCFNPQGIKCILNK